MNRIGWIGALVFLGLLSGCNLEEGDSGAPAYTCDASDTFLDMCIEEPAVASSLSSSKETCKDVKGVWSDTKKCPSGYKKKCPDGDKFQYFYAAGDDKKACAELVSLFEDRYVQSLLVP
jgi:hypothetical protein